MVEKVIAEKDIFRDFFSNIFCENRFPVFRFAHPNSILRDRKSKKSSFQLQ
jgi:hypothetical protein